MSTAECFVFVHESPQEMEMIRIMTSGLVAAALLGSSSLNFGFAHEGHGSPGRQAAPGSRSAAPDRQPFGPRLPQRDGHHHDHTPAKALTIPRVQRPRDLRSLAFRLEFAAEIVADEICSERRRASTGSEALVAAVALENAARHFRTSLDQARDVDHAGKDFATVIEEFRALSRLLARQRGSLLIDRAMFRVDRLAGEIKQQLSNGKAVDHEQPPALPGAAPPLPDALPVGPIISIPREAQGIRLLPSADQAAALAQRTCPVTGDRLGADGKPLKVQVGGRTVFVCCESCVDELKANPEAYLSSGKRR